MNERPYSKAGYCDVCTRWFETPVSGNCDCGGKILLTPGTQFNRELVQVPRVELEELVWVLEATAITLRNSPLFGALNPMGKASAHADRTAAKFRAKYLEVK